ncbi:MAG TPA: AMP-binding protein [Myxococcota bacterium]|nr:AMP-binding protein [Myxococcota bacterium]
MSRVSRPDPARAELDARVLAWMREPGFAADEARFDALARDLFAFQVAHCPPYARFCEARGRTPERVASWREIPAVPTGAFKELALRSFPPERTCKVFRTSGTTDERRGALHLDTVTVYEASLGPTFERFVLPDLAPGERALFAVLAAAPGEAPDSSLSHMFGALLARRGAEGSRFFVRGGRLDVDALLKALGAAAQRPEPIALCGTAFAFVHLLEALEAGGRALRLPETARLMETGGFKGRARERSRDELYAELEARLGVPPARVVNQYGMTELGSQFYDSVLREPDAPRRKLGPPWARARVVDPESGEECAPGEVGLLAVVDLANTGSVLALQTADVARSLGDGFELVGRAPGAEARGCSIAADALLGATG